MARALLVCSIPLLALALAGCGESLGTPEADEDLGITGPVTYSEHIEPLLQACIGCHGATSPRAGVSLHSYEAAKANATRANDPIQDGLMPPGGGLRASERSLFQSWIDDGLQP